MKGNAKKQFREYGTHPWRAIVLHGGPGAPGCAAGLCRGIGEHFSVIEHLQKAKVIEGLMDEIIAVMDAHSLEKTILIGHSFGAWLAMLFAEKYPERVEKIVVIGCGPMETKYLPQLIQTRAERKASGREDTDNYCALPNSSGDMLYFNEEQHIALMNEISAMRESGELLERARRVACPVTAFHGSFDPHPAEAVRDAMESLPDFRMIVMDRCGHDPWKETYARDKFFSMLFEELK